MKANRQAGIHLHSSWITKTGATKHKTVKEYYWILIANNGKTIARSSETYKRKGSAVRSIEIVSDIMRFGSPGAYYDHSGKDVKQLLIDRKSK